MDLCCTGEVGLSDTVYIVPLPNWEPAGGTESAGMGWLLGEERVGDFSPCFVHSE